jgi:MHS family proline/betaine transporter-like MFS transporter
MDVANSDSSHARAKRVLALAAISAGNALEWFDFVIYGYFAVTIADNFFPVGNKTASLLLTFGTFGIAFLMRPIGAVVIGNYADRYGRKPALTLTIFLMMMGTAIIASAPAYSSVGLFAPLLITFGRIFQGFSAGGEFGSATALLAEQDPKRRGFFASWQFSSQALTVVFATLFGAILSVAMSSAQLQTWGWRIPFLCGLLIGPVAYYIRRRIDESHEFQATAASKAPFYELLSFAKERLLVAFGAVSLLTAGTYTLVFMTTFAVQQLGLPLSAGFRAGLLTGTIQIVLVPIVGRLSDKWGRLPIALTTAIAIMLIVYPLLSWLTAAPTLGRLLVFQISIGVLIAGYAGALAALISELFPTRLRTTGLSVSYSFAVAIFGGFAPFINTLLIELTGDKLAPSYYLMIAAAITIRALMCARRLGLR